MEQASFHWASFALRDWPTLWFLDRSENNNGDTFKNRGYIPRYFWLALRVDSDLVPKVQSLFRPLEPSKLGALVQYLFQTPVQALRLHLCCLQFPMPTLRPGIRS